MAETKKKKRLIRPRQGRKIAGVCAGVANYFKVDVVFVRVFWILLAIPGGLPGIIPYLAFWLVMPNE